MLKKIVTVIGGGTGTMPVLSGLKHLRNIDLRVVVSMTDDGGSNRVVRDEYGILPLSDLRKSIIALCTTKNQILRKLFVYRFPVGQGLSGHTLGNLIMLALADISKSEYHAIKIISEIFKVKGRIIPVTYAKTELCAKYFDGSTIQGESNISRPVSTKRARIEKLFLCPSPEANLAAIKSIKESDFLIIGPGDLYTSTLANIIVQGIPEAIRNSKAKIIFISNLMTKHGETRGMRASDLVKEIEKYIHKHVDIVVLNNAKINPKILEKYHQVGEKEIENDLRNSKEYNIVCKNIISNKEVIIEQGDSLERSILRHDKIKLQKVLRQIIFGNNKLEQ